MSETDALQLVERVRTELAILDDKIRRHPYLAAVEAGKVSLDSLKGFAGHQYHIIGSDLRSVAYLISRHGALPGRKFLLNILQGEMAAFDACITFAGALGMDESRLSAFEPRPAGQAYANYVAWLACYGSDAELSAAFLVNFAAWGANCARMGSALKKRYGLDDKALAFFELFAETPPSFEQDALSVISDGLKRGIEPRLIVRAARLLQGYELMYWDTMSTL